MVVDILFYGFTIFAILGALGTISFSHPINSAISFLITLLCIAGFYSLIDNPFLFIMQITIYSGAIMVTILFVIMYLNVQKEKTFFAKKIFFKIVGAAIILIPFIYIFFDSLNKYKADKVLNKGVIVNIENIGKSIFNDWFLPFELISVLLLVVLIGVVILLNKKGERK